MPGSRMFIDPKMQVPVEDLIKGMIVQSGNDATMALAEGVGGTAEHFVELMNQQAKALGMKSTSYKNPEGLTEAGHTTTARDLSILSTRLMTRFPRLHRLLGHQEVPLPRHAGHQRHQPQHAAVPRPDGRWPEDRPHQRRRLLHDRHGQARISQPGRAGKPGSRRLLAIVLGTTSDSARANESQKLLNWGYTAFEAVKLFDAGQAVVTPAVWKGKDAAVKLGRPEAIVVAVPAGSASKIKTQVARPEPLVAPFKKGQPVGSLKIMLGDNPTPMAEVPLMALEAVEEAGIMGRAWDSIRLWIK